MNVVRFTADFCVALFLLGLIGSLLVIVVTFIEDLELFFEDQEPTDQTR